MNARINDLLEALWSDIKIALNDNRNGIDVKKLEDLLQAHSRYILSALGQSNIQSLPPAVVENIFKYFLPYGIDPLIRSLLSYVEIDRANEAIYLDPINTISEATQALKTVLEGIAENASTVNNLAWLQYKVYQGSIAAWREVLGRVGRTVKSQLVHNEIYLSAREEIASHHGDLSRELINWETYLERIQQRETALRQLKMHFDAQGDSLPDSFYSTSMATWKQLMALDPEAESYWLNLWNRREHRQQTSIFMPSFIYQRFLTARKVVAATLNFVGLEKGTYYLKTDKQVIKTMIDQRIQSYQDTTASLQTLSAIRKAKGLVISENVMLEAQINQLTQLEAYLSSVMASLSAYASYKQLLDNKGLAFFLKLRAWLGFRKAIEERDSIKNLITSKASAFTKVGHSTLNVLHALQTVKNLPQANWNDAQFQTIKNCADKLHATASGEAQALQALHDSHNEKFCHEWHFWERKTLLTGLFESISQDCPLGPRI